MAPSHNMIKQLTDKIVVQPQDLEKLRNLIYDTARGGREHCGTMIVRYHPTQGYILYDFVENYYDSRSTSCMPKIGLRSVDLEWHGYWHTHPYGLCSASGIDLNTMQEDALVAYKGISPGLPSISVIFSMRNNEVCIKGYVPTFQVDALFQGGYAYEIRSIDPIIKSQRDKAFEYYGMIVHEEKTIVGGKYYILEIVGRLDQDYVKDENYGVYIGSHVPPHGINTILAFFMKNGRKEIWLYHELYGLMRARVNDVKPEILEMPVEVRSVGFGREERLTKLEKEYKYPLSELSKKSVAIFGLGFLGSRVAEMLANYVGRLILVDADKVGFENIGYQTLYSDEDVNMYKVNAIARELMKRHLNIRIIPIVHFVKNPSSVFSNLIDGIVSTSDLVITAFDSLPPRLTVMMAAAKNQKPLIDIAVGINDGVVKIWIPSLGLSCPGCYILEGGLTADRNIYASKPHLASILVGIAVEMALSILLGNVNKSNFNNKLKIELAPNSISIKEERVIEDKGCPWHKDGVSIRVNVNGEDIEYYLEPWSDVRHLMSKICDTMGIDLNKCALVAERKIEDNIDEVKLMPGNTVAWAYQLTRLGYKLFIKV